MNGMFHDFAIETITGEYKKITMDGKELSGVVGVKIDMEVNSLSTVTIEFRTNHVSVDLKNEPMKIEESTAITGGIEDE